MTGFLEALLIVITLGLIYVAILGITASFFHPGPGDSDSCGRDAKEEEAAPAEAALTIIRENVTDIYIRSAADVYQYAGARIGAAATEYMLMLLVASDGRLMIEFECTDKCREYVRFPSMELIIQNCRNHDVDAIYIVHNHPNGTLYPSTDDLFHTARLAQTLQKMDITIKDHIIITDNQYFSIKEKSAGCDSFDHRQ